MEWLFDNSGTKLYVVGPNSDNANQYTLSTPWDLSTAILDRETVLV
jgi:hypothetical protein